MIRDRQLPLITALAMTTAHRQVFEVLPITVLDKQKLKKQTNKQNKQKYLT